MPEKDLPVVLPFIEDFKPDDSGVSPLARHEEWYRVACPSCGKTGRRETDVSDTFLDSAWYFLRYPSVGHDDVPFEKTITKKWLPVTSYIGGNEHAVLHLLYSRFITMVLHDAGMLDFEEPYTRFRAHGHIIREGAKMSKTQGNIVNPDEYIEHWGADAFRTYLMFLGPYEQGGDFRDQSISGTRRFLDRLFASVQSMSTDGEPDHSVMRKLHQTIRKVSEDVSRLSYNTAIAAMMEYMNVLRKGERTPHREEIIPLIPARGPIRPAHRRGAVGADGRHRKRVRFSVAALRPRARGGRFHRARGAGERKGALEDHGAARHRRGSRGSRRTRRSDRGEVRGRRAEEDHLRSGAAAQHCGLSAYDNAIRAATTDVRF